MIASRGCLPTGADAINRGADQYATLHHDLTKQRIKRILFAGAPVLNGKLDLAVEWNLP